MERLRQAVWYGMDHKLGEKVTPLHFSLTPTASALPGGRMFATTTAYLRPNFSAGRGSYISFVHTLFIVSYCIVYLCTSHSSVTNIVN